MYRKARGGGRKGILDLDSLMDILSCLVGVMLFLVIYTVLELGSVSFAANIPDVRNLPEANERVIVIASEGTVRVLDARGPIEQLMSGFEIVRYPDVPRFVEQSNERAPSDPSFSYELVFANRLSALGSPIAAVDLRIEERIGAVGDSIHQIDDGSAFAQQLARLDPGSTWLSFAVDAWSLDVFRAARAWAVERGFVTRWEPATIDFPVTHVMAEGGAEVLLTPQTMRFKPQR
jgi:hypothetical protein